MPTLVSCPECQRKLKVAPASIGRSVKCPCGNVFKAHESDDAAESPAPAPSLLIVACAGCGTKLKVPASARGRKMKCSKCGMTFIAGAADAPPSPPVKSKPTPPVVSDEFERDEEPFVTGGDAETPPIFEDDEAEPKPRARSKPRPTPMVDDEESAPRKQPAPPPAPSGTLGCLLNVFVLLLVLGYIAIFVPLYLGMANFLFTNPLPHAIEHHDDAHK